MVNKVQVDLPPTGLKDFGSMQTALLQCLYVDEQRILIEKEFGGGFGGARVLLVRPINRQGRQLARQIVKIGPPLPLKKEQQNYDEYVGKIHPFVVAQVTRYVEWQGLGGIIYNFVGDSRLGPPRTLEEYFQDEQVSVDAINHTLEGLLNKALGKLWYHETEPHTCFFDDEYGPHLVEYLRVKLRPYSQDGLWPADQAPETVEGYRQLNSEAIPADHMTLQPETLVRLDGLVITEVKPAELKLQHPTRPGIVVKVETPSAANFAPDQTVTVCGEVRSNRPARLAEIVTAAFANFSEARVEPQAQTLLWDNQTYPNPLHLYPKILSRTLDGKKSLVHGDLHLRNILVDEAGQGWLIDFALVQERHNLYDFIKLETYIRQMVLSQPQYDFSFAEYLQFETALIAETGVEPHDPILRKAYQVIRRIRQIAKLYVKRNFDEEYLPALFLYNLAVLKYVENHGHKAARLAFGTAGVVGRALTATPPPSKKQKTQRQLIEDFSSLEISQVSRLEKMFDIAAIRELLAVALDSHNLIDLCHNYFPEVHKEFTPEMGNRMRIELLIDYCERHNQLRQLVGYIRTINPEKYHEYFPRLVKPVLNKFKSKKDEDHIQATKILGELGEPGAIPLLKTQLLKQQNPDVGYWLAIVIGKIGGPDAEEALDEIEQQLRSQGTDPFTLLGVEDAKKLARSKTGSSGVPPILDH